jgi:hypothetical protein
VLVVVAVMAVLVVLLVVLLVVVTVPLTGCGTTSQVPSICLVLFGTLHIVLPCQRVMQLPAMIPWWCAAFCAGPGPYCCV